MKKSGGISGNLNAFSRAAMIELALDHVGKCSTQQLKKFETFPRKHDSESPFLER